MAKTTWVVGFTGAVGAGCTTAVQQLQYSAGYVAVRLSDIVREEWRRRHGDDEPTREQLQALGDELRAGQGLAVLVDRALSGVETGSDAPPIAIDGVRNLGEVEELQDRFGRRFSLVGVLAPTSTRWDRISIPQYLSRGLTQADFEQDNYRDQGEDHENGQQVGLCVDAADAIINNSGTVALEDYKLKVLDYAEVLTGAKKRAPTDAEIRMYTATSQSHSSRCLKRHVGAVVVGTDGEVVGVGYNENPLTTHPCVDEPLYHGRCFRDIVRNRQFQQLVEGGTKCPVCGNALEPLVGPPWQCTNCTDGVPRNLEPFFFPERAMNWCTAIHAEDRALRKAGASARGGWIYTTTFPCFGCAEKIISAGIAHVVFTEPYPDAESAGRLAMASVKVHQFEGVRSSAFERVFAGNRPR